jgi:hypothetical protein
MRRISQIISQIRSFLLRIARPGSFDFTDTKKKRRKEEKRKEEKKKRRKEGKRKRRKRNHLVSDLGYKPDAELYGHEIVRDIQ